VGGFLHLFEASPDGPLPFAVEFRRALAHGPGPRHIIASFPMTDLGDPLVYSYQAAHPNLLLPRGRYFALFTTQQAGDAGGDLSVAFDAAGPYYTAGLGSAGVVDASNGTGMSLGDAYPFSARIQGFQISAG
jgi:hypothetical protein